MRRPSRSQFIAAGLCATAAALCLSRWLPAAPPVRLRVGFSEFSPYIDVDENNRPAGLAVQVLERAAARTGSKLIWVSVDDAETALRSGAVDVFPLFTVTPERSREFHISEPWWESSQALISLREHALKSPSATSGKR